MGMSGTGDSCLSEGTLTRISSYCIYQVPRTTKLTSFSPVVPDYSCSWRCNKKTMKEDSIWFLESSKISIQILLTNFAGIQFSLVPAIKAREKKYGNFRVGSFYLCVVESDKYILNTVWFYIIGGIEQDIFQWLRECTMKWKLEVILSNKTVGGEIVQIWTYSHVSKKKSQAIVLQLEWFIGHKMAPVVVESGGE